MFARRNRPKTTPQKPAQPPALQGSPGALKASLPQSDCPQHIAVIMDGNRRWAEERGLPRQAGYRAGTENIRRLIQSFGARGVRYLTLFAFSTENWKRPQSEINPLFRLIGRVLDRELRALHENGVRLLHIGNLAPLAPDLQRRIHNALELTKDNDHMTVCVAFNYGGRAEIVEAVKRIVAEGVAPESIDEACIEAHLDTNGVPDPDLVIRTSGEMRLSNFLIWQSAYAEYYTTPVYWPDFDDSEIDRAINAYAKRGRRYGGHENLPTRQTGLRLNDATVQTNGHIRMANGGNPGLPAGQAGV
jgi:undecaprenyl diphosphate synthase